MLRLDTNCDKCGICSVFYKSPDRFKFDLNFALQFIIFPLFIVFGFIVFVHSDFSLTPHLTNDFSLNHKYVQYIHILCLSSNLNLFDVVAIIPFPFLSQREHVYYGWTWWAGQIFFPGKNFLILGRIFFWAIFN